MTASFVWLHNLNLNLPALGSKVVAGPSLLYSELASLFSRLHPSLRRASVAYTIIARTLRWIHTGHVA